MQFSAFSIGPRSDDIKKKEKKEKIEKTVCKLYSTTNLAC